MPIPTGTAAGPNPGALDTSIGIPPDECGEPDVLPPEAPAMVVGIGSSAGVWRRNRPSWPVWCRGPEPHSWSPSTSRPNATVPSSSSWTE